MSRKPDGTMWTSESTVPSESTVLLGYLVATFMYGHCIFRRQRVRIQLPLAGPWTGVPMDGGHRRRVLRTPDHFRHRAVPAESPMGKLRLPLAAVAPGAGP